MIEYSLKEGFLNEGDVVIFPTDTVYGLSCRLYDNVGINKILHIKNRSITKHLAILCDTLVTVSDIAILNERALTLAHAFWPGPLTLILTSTESHFKKSGQKTVGIRIPNHSGAIRLIRQNGPLVTTSVNISGKEAMTDINEIKNKFSDVVDYIYQEEKTNYLNVSSTTVDLTEKEVKVLREGTITKKEIIEVLELTNKEVEK